MTCDKCEHTSICLIRSEAEQHCSEMRGFLGEGEKAVAYEFRIKEMIADRCGKYKERQGK